MTSDSGRDKPSRNYNQYIVIVLTALVGTAIGHYFQARSWEKEHDDHHIHENREIAKEVFNELSLTMTKRSFQIKSYMLAVEEEDTAKETQRRKQYQQTLEEWNYHLQRNRSLVEYSFGKANRNEFDNEIQKRFGLLNVLIRNSDSIEAKSLLMKLDSSIYDFNLKMIRMIQKGCVGDSREMFCEKNKTDNPDCCPKRE
jgi:hypothetical protein